MAVEINEARTSRNEKMIHPTNTHLPTLKGMLTQPFKWSQVLKISFDQDEVVGIVIAEKISET